MGNPNLEKDENKGWERGTSANTPKRNSSQKIMCSEGPHEEGPEISVSSRDCRELEIADNYSKQLNRFGYVIVLVGEMRFGSLAQMCPRHVQFAGRCLNVIVHWCAHEALPGYNIPVGMFQLSKLFLATLLLGRISRQGRAILFKKKMAISGFILAGGSPEYNQLCVFLNIFNRYL